MITKLRTCTTFLRNLLQSSKSINSFNSPSIYQLRNIQCISNNSQQKQSTCTKTKEEWQNIYSLKSINIFVGINKLKNYQAVLTVASVPIAMALESSSIVGSGFTEICAAIGLSGLLTLTLYSVLSTNLIGYVYVNSTNSSLIRFSHIDFWGRRKNIELNLNDIESDPCDLKYGAYLPVTTTINKTNYKLLPHFGLVTNRREFTNIFGEF